MAKLKHIQVFTSSDKDYCEVSGLMINCKVQDGVLMVKHQEDGSKDIWENWFPLHTVTMVRISDFNEKD